MDLEKKKIRMTGHSNSASRKENVAGARNKEYVLVEGAESESMKPFVKKNFLFMGISLLLIIVGFLLMTGSANNDPTQFNPDIFSARRIVVGPTMAFIGFVAMAFSIVYSPKQKESLATEEQADTQNTEVL